MKTGMTVSDSLADGLWRLDLGSVNAYLVDDGTVTLVDAGTSGTADNIRRGFEEAGYAPGDVDRVLVTHFDIDHVGGLTSLSLDAPVYAMEPDASMLAGERKPPLTNKKGLLQRGTGLMLTRPEAPITRVSDGETVGGFTAYHTPGHTPGHVTFHHSQSSAAFLGDLVSGNGDLGTLPWPLAYSNAKIRTSIRRLADLELGFDLACMGHGEPITTDGADALAALAARQRGN
jgi:glyoxylase-like metal-dependent hydrolase (beta-lactamase superfamily II)